MRIPSLLIFLIILSSCAAVFSPEGKNGQIIVTAYHNGAITPGVTLYLVENMEQYPSRVSYALRTDEEGEAAFSRVKAGVYFLIGQGVVGNHRGVEMEVFGYFGGNPLYINEGDSLELVLPLVDHRKSERSPGGGETVITGTVEYEGKGLKESYIYAYVDPVGYFRDPSGAVLGKTDDSGYFEMSLSPGTYYLVSRRRKSGLMAGPLEKGDYFGYFPGNPVAVGEGERVTLILPVVQLKMRNDPLYRKKGIATISGRIMDDSGKSVAGAYAALYDNPDLLNKPLFVSVRSGEDGSFVINVPLPGIYYLGARTGYGGAPGPGDLYGRYEGTVDHAIEVKRGDSIKGVMIVVSEVW